MKLILEAVYSISITYKCHLEKYALKSGIVYKRILLTCNVLIYYFKESIPPTFPSISY